MRRIFTNRTIGIGCFSIYGCQPPFTLWNCQESKCKCLEKVQRGGKEVKNMEI